MDGHDLIQKSKEVTGDKNKMSFGVTPGPFKIKTLPQDKFSSSSEDDSESS
jgi:hypothetical protein